MTKLSLVPIVGIGASAGGLDAFTRLLQSLPTDSGMAFVLVQHLSASQPSVLANILSRATSMPVTEVNNEPRIEANHVYVIPPGRNMIVEGDGLLLLPREAGELHRPIDQFFRSLATERRHQAIGVVLSGTATDGTLGLEAIKGEGGITFAQDGTAQYEGMPHSAVASGCVDLVLSPEDMAREIRRIGRHPLLASGGRQRATTGKPDLSHVLAVLHKAKGVDFADYRFNTIYRRVSRRMLLRKLDAVADYADLLVENPKEVEALYQDILINVTSFFRDAEAFEEIKTTVFPRLLEGRKAQEPVRLWSLGCSTGQEAYSMAMAFMEVAEAAGSSVSLQVFATDLNAASIEKARSGNFPKDIVQDVSAERLARFFTETESGYRINKQVRDACIFSRHNVLTSPPLSRIDLISCRNLLIYLEPVLQQKIMPTLHYALKPGGFLWLGGSETVGIHRTLFHAEDAKNKIYSKIPGSKAAPLDFMVPRRGQIAVAAAGKLFSAIPETDLPREADRLLAARFAPPCVLVTPDLEVLQYRGDTSAYLTPAPGRASLSLLKMLRDGLLIPVRAAVQRAAAQGPRVREEGLRVTSNGRSRDVSIEVIALREKGASVGFLIMFEEGSLPPAEDTPNPMAPADTTVDAEVARLQRELAATREYLQSLIEQQEAANDALQSANEEAQSANEELQSSNEEMETAKEEIESSSEELATINDELNDRNREVNHANNDLINLFASIQTAIVLVGPDLRIRRFTPLAEKVLNLVQNDVGRLLADVKISLEGLPDLGALLKQVVETGTAHTRDVQDRNGCWYSLRLRPYRTADHSIDGVVVVIVDVDVLKRAHDYTESIVATVREPLLVLNADLTVRSASASFFEAYHVTPEQTLGRRLFDLGNGQWNIKELRRVLEELLPQHQRIDDFEVEHHFDVIGLRTVKLNARRLVQLNQQEPLILVAIEDVTEAKRQAGALRQLASDLSDADRRKNEFLAMLAHELRNPLAPILNSVEILQVPGAKAEARAPAFAMLTRQVKQMVRLVDDLLDVSRISLGKIELRREVTDLNATLGSVADASRPNFNRLEQQLSVTVPEEELLVNVDPTRFSQVIGNLLNNASKFSPRKSRISLTLGREGTQAVISVRDSGMGIAADQIGRIFDLFVQGDTSLERSVNGLGIGLTLVKRLVEAHQGTVEVRSGGLGEGSEFIVRLPLMLGANPIEELANSLKGFASVSPRRILVVDDNKDSADSLSVLLQLYGHETELAADGVAAVEAAERFRPELILLDIGLPKLNGYEVCRLVRAKPWGEKIVILALTGWGESAARQASLDAGFDGHLVKPINLADLEPFLS